MKNYFSLIILLGMSVTAFAGEGSSTATDTSEALACSRAQEAAQQTAELNLIESPQGLKEGETNPSMQVHACECFEMSGGDWECTAPWSVN